MTAKNGTYVIGCKLPNGLVIRGAGKQVRLKGANSSLIFGGYGTTEDVPAEVWEDYAKIHKDSNVIKNGTVFAVGDLKSARDAALERSDVKTGLEGLDPNKQSTKEDKE